MLMFWVHRSERDTQTHTRARASMALPHRICLTELTETRNLWFSIHIFGLWLIDFASSVSIEASLSFKTCKMSRREAKTRPDLKRLKVKGDPLSSPPALICNRALFDLPLAAVITGFILIGRGIPRGRPRRSSGPVSAPLPVWPPYFLPPPPGHHYLLPGKCLFVKARPAAPQPHTTTAERGREWFKAASV